jgi:hypothetical protein
MGAQPGFLGRVVEAGFHQRAIRMVPSGSVDAAAIDSQVLAIELRDHPRLANGLRAVGAFGPSTIQPVGDAAYDDIQAMLATIEAAGWTSTGQAVAVRCRQARVSLITMEACWSALTSPDVPGTFTGGLILQPHLSWGRVPARRPGMGR